MNESKATRHQRLRRRVRAASVASAAVMLATVALTPVAGWLRDLAMACADGLSDGAAVIVALVVFVLAMVVLCELATLPAAIYLARHDASVYRQSPPAVEEVVAAQAHAALIALPAALATGSAVALSVAVAGRWWWLAAGPLLALLLGLALRFAPAAFAWLGQVRPLDRPELVGRLLALAARARVAVVGIDEWVVDDSAPAMALVAGVGPARRVLVSSEIARRWSDDEIAVVVAHEIAHHVHRDLWRTFALHVALLWMSLFAADVAARWWRGAPFAGGVVDLAVFPLVALVGGAVWVLATPLRHAQSRRHERRADRFALEVTGAFDAFGVVVSRLGARHLAEERPSALTRWLYHSHPSVAERLALAEAFERARLPPVSRAAAR